MSGNEREILSKIIFNELRVVGFPKFLYNENELFNDFKNVENSSIRYENGILKCYGAIE